MPRLIVNADDFGLTVGVNRAIEQGHSDGVVSATSVLVTREAAGEAGELARRFPELDIGLHVNLTLGAPVSDPSQVPSLVDSEGRFLSRGALRRRVALRRANPTEVYREVAAQIARLRGFGADPVHWDSHMTIAIWPGLVGPLAAAAQAEGLQCARSPKLWVVEPGRSPAAARWRRRLRKPRRLGVESARQIAHRVLRGRFRLPDWRLSPNFVSTPGDYRDRWMQLFDSLPPGTSEMVSHPGVATDLEVLVDPALARRLAAQSVELIGFRHLIV